MAKPEGVRIVRTDGTEIDCELIHIGEDWEGMDVWEVTGVVFREGDKLMTQATGQPKFEVVAESETTFAPRAFPAKLTFIKDANGKVTGVRLNQGGREINGKKIK